MWISTNTRSNTNTNLYVQICYLNQFNFKELFWAYSEHLYQRQWMGHWHNGGGEIGILQPAISGPEIDHWAELQHSIQGVCGYLSTEKSSITVSVSTAHVVIIDWNNSANTVTITILQPTNCSALKLLRATYLLEPLRVTGHGRLNRWIVTMHISHGLHRITPARSVHHTTDITTRERDSMEPGDSVEPGQWTGH